MRYPLSPHLAIHNERISESDAKRQTLTAQALLERLEDQPGVILADEVGMGKTFVALAVALSVIEATDFDKPVVIMVPSALQRKWPREWAVFAQECATDTTRIRVSEPIKSGVEFLKLLDDPPDRRKHLIFLEHGALTRKLSDSFVHLSLIRQATARRPELLKRRSGLARAAAELLHEPWFRDTVAVERLLELPEAQWYRQWNSWYPNELKDDPVPAAIIAALPSVDLDQLRAVLETVPMKRTATYDDRLKAARKELTRAAGAVWKSALGALDERLPLLILDEAHHVKNETQIARLFSTRDAQADADALQGPLGNMFEHMLFLTATPFQLGHGELLSVLSRFAGARFPSDANRSRFTEQMDELRAALDHTQGIAREFERSWARLAPEDADSASALTTFKIEDSMSDQLRAAVTAGNATLQGMERAQQLLHPWVVRHQKPRKDQRRKYRPGGSINRSGSATSGIAIEGSSTLPFLLAARAEAVVSAESTNGQTTKRSYYAYGIASSFEAYRDTRMNARPTLDDSDQDTSAEHIESAQLRWYLDRIDAALPRDSAETGEHPKIRATVDRVVDLWSSGQKVLVFCFYRRTGQALRSHVSRALRAQITTLGARKLDIVGAPPEQVSEALEALSRRLLRDDSPGYRQIFQHVADLAAGLEDTDRKKLADVVIRFMRTDSYLVRLPNLRHDLDANELVKGFDRPDSSGASLAQRVGAFARFLRTKPELERQEILESLLNVKTGDISVQDLDEGELTSGRESILPNVRLANGGVKQKTRQELMVTFNTPFFPEVLIASSVMSEGVDLHIDCRHVIHHDLDWNPATLEQRTGRLDRIGSKAMTVNQPVVIYEPYLAGTHDEKMFRVVKEREKWFGVVMGETLKLDEKSTEEFAARVPLPEALAQQLSMDLSV